MLPQQYCLRWRYHHSNLQTMFSQLLEREAFCDVTLACEGRTIKAHKIVLSACSTYFETILSQYEEKDPILIMKDVKYVDIKCLVEFMYKGEINVEHCHLATLLKTAEELKIKGLAEVSWRDEEQSSNPDANSNGVQTVMPQVQTVMPNSPNPTTRRKRGRPPIDDYDQSFTTPKIANISGGNQDDAYSNDAMSSSEHDLNIWDEDQSANEAADNTDAEQPPIKVKKEVNENDEMTIDEQSNISLSASDSKDNKFAVQQQIKGNGVNAQNISTASGNQSFLTPTLEKEWPDVVKMNDYLHTGRRQQFWEEPFTKRVMDAIKTKNLEMKVAAELLGVSYGTLYGRYRDSYGCLKHPYRVRDFWTEQGPTDILLKLKRKGDHAVPGRGAAERHAADTLQLPAVDVPAGRGRSEFLQAIEYRRVLRRFRR
ncbi:unnamed protein product [Phyllotreta striolata]|uniref:BTB domain-containing protein n=1 Tax=Phyllotreta striolata TaxID=444603 RepID=A0A9P0DJ57_PHYSR|nr:unnamed protein product [Phyllotreta striolata]